MVKGLAASQNPILGSFSPAQQLFLQLWAEQSASYSIDSYQVRLCNGRTILSEIAQVAEWILAGECSSAELGPLRAEALELVREDPVLSSRMRHKTNPLLNSLGKLEGGSAKEAATRAIRYQCKSVLARVEPRYEASLVEGLGSAMAQGDRAGLCAAVRAWMSDLVSRGECPASLHSLGKRFLRPGEATFDERFAWLGRSLGSNRAWSVYLPVRNPPVREGDLADIPLRAVVASGASVRKEVRAFRQEVAHGIDPGATYVVIRDLYAPSPDDALATAWTVIEERLNLIHVSRRNAWEVAPKGVVTGPAFSFARLVSLPASHFEPPTSIEGSLEVISEASGQLDSSGRERLLNACRFYRLGVSAESHGPRFLNLWISLETLLRAGGGGRERVGATLCCILTRRYGYRLLRNLVEDMGRMEVAPAAIGLPADPGREQLAELVRLLQDPGRVQRAVAQVASIPLLAYRIEECHGTFGDGRLASQALERHHRRLSWHLSRLNRARNRIVHSADVWPSLGILNSHLHSYCRAALMELTWLLKRNRYTDLDHLLQDVRDGLRLQGELLANSAGVYDERLLLDPPLSSVP